MKELKNKIRKNPFLLPILKSFNYLKLKISSPKRIFTKIYQKNGWRDSESLSGTGSNYDETRNIINKLPTIFKKYEINSLLDLPCGDFNWMKNVDLSNIDYIGGDIVKEVINKNKKQYSKSNIDFKEINIIEDDLPKVDLVFVRDCFVHLSFKDVKKSLKKIKESGSKYLITTSFVGRNKNKDIATGEWRTLNFQIEPFNLPEPLEIIDEECGEGDGEYKDKALIMWKISDLNV